MRNGCWHPKSFEKAVIIIIDALRYDFTVPSQFATNTNEPLYYLDNFPLMYDIAASHPENAILLPFIADPPTSTLQRLKGLTTGTLPVFIDIGSNFAGTAIEEDNIVGQLKDAGKVVVHLGDDTWHSLFPGYFDPNLTHSYDSFNVWDLHTVDNGVIEHIMPLLTQTHENNWDVIIGHFLGVDHAGHRYGPNHPAMAEKLKQMNTVLGNIVQSIDDQTLLVVMGDHGMDPKGDHGGESDDEVEAALWMYSKTPKFGRIDAATSKPPLTAKERPVGQIDLVSTLSLLLGLPIPFNNLGTPIPEAFAGSGRVDWQNLAKVDLLAFHQIQNYHNEYSRSQEIESNANQQKAYEIVRKSLQESSGDKWEMVHKSYTKWHKETIGMYRSLWANFDLIDMLHGVELISLALVVLLYFSRFVKGDKSETITGLLPMIGIGFVAGIPIGLFLVILVPAFFTLFGGILFGAFSCSILGALIFAYQTKDQLVSSMRPSTWSWLAIVFCITQSAGFAANSFTIHEDTILLFFLSTFGLVATISSVRQASKSDRILGVYQSVMFVLLTRLASYSRLCREEQMPGCQSTFYSASNSSTSAPWQLLVPYSVALILPEIVKAFYKGTASYEGSAGFWIGFCFRIGLFLVSAYWTIDAADNGDWFIDSVSSTTLKTISITIARCALAIAIPIGIGTFIWAQPCINILISEPNKAQPEGVTSKPQVTILGYANTFGARYFLLIPILTLSTILLLPPMGQFSIAICAWQILCLLEILDTNGLTVSNSSNASIGPIVLAMLGSYHFFKTGHQAVLSAIQWNAAFVPLRTITYPWSPLLVLFNSFGAQILCAAAVPLVVLWKRPVSPDGLRGVWGDVTNATLTHILYYATIQLATTLWAGHLRRHLMLYRVFMPRFLMASGVLAIVELVLVCIALPAVRVTGLSVGEIFGY